MLLVDNLEDRLFSQETSIRHIPAAALTFMNLMAQGEKDIHAGRYSGQDDVFTRIKAGLDAKCELER